MTTSTDLSVPDDRILQAASEVGVLGTGMAALPLVLARLCDPTATAESVAAVVAQEPGLAARVLRVANSAYYGASGSVATLERAFVLLGVDAVRGIAAAACLDRTLVRALQSAPVRAEALLGHSLAAGVAAEALARRGPRHLASEAFVGGLLHDFGITVQLQVDRRAFDRLAAAVKADPDRSIRDHERAEGCVAHERCAAVSFRAWKLPSSLIAAVSVHHDAGTATEAQALAQLIALGNYFALRGGFGHQLEPPANGAQTPLPATIVERVAALGIDITTLADFEEALPERVRSLLGAATA